MVICVNRVVNGVTMLLGTRMTARSVKVKFNKRKKDREIEMLEEIVDQLHNQLHIAQKGILSKLCWALITKSQSEFFSCKPD